MTFRDHLAAVRARLTAAGIPASEAALDAELMARHVLGWDRATFIARGNEDAPPGFTGALGRLVARRVRREPMAYVRGTREFWGREFAVTPAVLVPRPETELIVEEALAQLAVRPSPFRAADVGTGSGCLAVTLALEMPGAHLYATDVSEDALAVARANADRLHARVDFVHGSLLAGAAGPFELIVSNPPYLPERDRAALQPEVRDFEPALALFAGPDGLDTIRALVPACAAALAPDGILLIEIGDGQAAEVAAIVQHTAGLTLSHVRPDLQNIPRVVVIRRF